MSDSNYNELAAALCAKVDARSVIVLVIDGKDGNGLGINIDQKDAAIVPKMLRKMAEALEKDGTKCPSCGYAITMHVGDTKPKPGALCICMNCGEVSSFDDELKLVAMNDDELAEKLSPKGLKALERARGHLKTKPEDN